MCDHPSVKEPHAVISDIIGVHVTKKRIGEKDIGQKK
jgi:hypothetical protein